MARSTPFMATPRRLAAYALALLVALLVVAQTPFPALLDHLHFERQVALFAKPADIELDRNILILDTPRRAFPGDETGPAAYRCRLRDLLQQLGAARPPPSDIILDIEFRVAGNACVPELRDAIRALTEQGPELWAVVNPAADDGSADYDDTWEALARDIYSALSGFGHTVHNYWRGVLSYQSRIGLRSRQSAGDAVVALTVMVAEKRHADPTAREPGSIVVAIGDKAAADAQTVEYVHDGQNPGSGYFQRPGATGGANGALDLTNDLNDKIVVVGSFDVDWDADMPQPGPQLLAWGLSDRLNAGTGAAAAFYQPESRVWVEVLEALVFAVLTALVFAVTYAYVKRLRTRPALIAVAATAIAVLGLAALALLRLNQHTVPPVGLATFAIVFVGLLAWHFAYKFLLTGQAEGSGHYDVFVSYSRAHADWVKKNVYEPLKAMRKADGSALEIYFDTKVLQLGKDFTANYMWAIVDSKVFIAVFTDDYYAKNHSRNEIDVAYHRKVAKLIKVLPIAVSPGAVPEIFRKDDYVDPAIEPNFMDKVRRAILTEVGPDAAPAT